MRRRTAGKLQERKTGSRSAKKGRTGWRVMAAFGFVIVAVFGQTMLGRTPDPQVPKVGTRLSGVGDRHLPPTARPATGTLTLDRAPTATPLPYPPGMASRSWTADLSLRLLSGWSASFQSVRYEAFGAKAGLPGVAMFVPREGTTRSFALPFHRWTTRDGDILPLRVHVLPFGDLSIKFRIFRFCFFSMHSHRTGR